MATNLSELIQSGLSGTLEALLAKNVTLEETTKSHPLDLQSSCVKVDVKFDFSSFTTIWKFFIPGISATHILNLMMGEEIEPTEDVDEGVVDALQEAVSNMCGGLCTSINGSDFEDLGNAQFTIIGNEIVDGKEYSQLDHLYRFALALEDDRSVEFYIEFDEPILPYIETITASEVTKHDEHDDSSTDEEDTVEDSNIEPEEKTGTTSEDERSEEELSSEPEEKTEEEKEDNLEEEIVEEQSTEDKDTKDEENTEEDTKKVSIFKKLNPFKKDESLSEEEQKKSKLKKIIIFLGVLIFLIIITAGAMLYLGMFDTEEKQEDVKVEELNATQLAELEKKENMVIIKSQAIKKHINFNISQIKTERLNRKLTFLTKYEILEDDAKEKLKAQEKERLYQLRQKELNKFANQSKEAPLKKYDTSDTNQTNAKAKVEELKKDFYLKIPTLKIKQYKLLISKSKDKNANLSICKSNAGRIQVFIGPFKSKKDREDILYGLKSSLLQDIEKLNYAQEEFNSICNITKD